MLSVNCKINVTLTEMADSVIYDATRATTFEIYDTKVYIQINILLE